MRFIDLTGKVFGKLTVIKETNLRKRKNIVWECLCECGKISNVCGGDLKYGNTKSCGCISSRHSAGDRTRTHGLSNTPLYGVWCSMRNRCYNKNQKSFKDYGLRGIAVCDRWNTFENFHSDMIETYKIGLTIERKDVNGNYCPENCIWITKKEQALNKRNLRIVTYKGYTSNLKNVCDHFKIDFLMVRNRLQKGWEVERALSQPKGNYKK